MSHTTSKKRQREQTQRDRRTQKEAHRLKRKTEGPRSQGQDDPDLAGMVAGPQPPQEEASTKWLRLVDTRSRDRPQSTIARKTLEVKLGLVVAGNARINGGWL